MIFYVIYSILVFQRFAELLIARSNERWMKKQGAEEYGQGHYPFMVLMHVAFFLFLLFEVMAKETPLHPLWGAWLVIFLMLQCLRIWVITSLGRYWNTKIIVLKSADVVSKGPYKWFRHPNYIVVTLEFIIIPLIFQAYWTLLIFGLLNQLILFVRIREEERVLRKLTSYTQIFDK